MSNTPTELSNPATLPTRERLIALSQDLFYRQGFHSVGLDAILREAGVTKTTFYNHFESKEALILAVLQSHDRWWRREFAAMLRRRGGETPAGQLRALPEVLADLFADGTFNGCIFVNAAAEFPLPHDPVHEAAAEHKRLFELILRDLALHARASDPIALAEQLSMVMEGAFVTQQVSRTERTVAIARAATELLCEKYLPR